MNGIPAVSQMLVTGRQKVKHFCCFYWKVTVFTVGFQCWTGTWRTYGWLCYRQNRNNLLSIPHTSWLFHTDHIFSHEWKMFHFILDPTYLFSGTFFYVRFYLFENGFFVSYIVFLLYLYVLLGFIFTCASCSTETHIHVFMDAVSSNTLTHEMIGTRWYCWCDMQYNHLITCDRAYSLAPLQKDFDWKLMKIAYRTSFLLIAVCLRFKIFYDYI
jgi:hypothetical protein